MEARNLNFHYFFQLQVFFVTALKLEYFVFSPISSRK